MRYRVISPDELPISQHTFKNEQLAEVALRLWIEKFKPQGYYKDANCERIPLDEVAARCRIEPIQEPTPIEREHYAKLVGGFIEAIEWGECNGEAMPVLVINKGNHKLHASVLRDAEGNGVGFIDIAEEW